MDGKFELKDFLNSTGGYLGDSMDYNNFEWMQSTGLKDKNGIEIFEGDLVKAEELVYEIFYDEIECGFKAETHQCDAANRLNVEGCFQLHEDEKEFYEVIGNIYENPKLIKP